MSALNNVISMSKPFRKPGSWRHWLFALSLLCFLGFYSSSLLHDHATDANELACPVCHVLSHQVLDLPPSELDIPGVLLILLLLLSPLALRIMARTVHIQPPSRAPPQLVC